MNNGVWFDRLHDSFQKSLTCYECIILELSEFNMTSLVFKKINKIVIKLVHSLFLDISSYL